MEAPQRPRPPGAWLAHGAVKPAVVTFSLLPFAWLVWGAFTDRLGANPAEYLERSTGELALRFLCLTLAVTPLRVMLGWPMLLRLRRSLGLVMAFYATLHLLCYAWFDMGFELGEIARDIPKRPFILVGFLAFAATMVLAATSSNRAVRALGGRRWQALHRLVYGIALLALLHFFWMRAGKNDFAEVAVYGAILGGLLAWRVWHRWRTGRVRPAAPMAAARR